MSAITWLYNYWYILIIAIAVIVYLIYELKLFYKLPNSEKVKRIKAILYALVVKAAEKYDEGSYDLILADVYNEFTNKYPIIKSLIPIDTVKNWIAEAFNKLKGYLASQGKTLATLHNPSVK